MGKDILPKDILNSFSLPERIPTTALLVITLGPLIVAAPVAAGIIGLSIGAAVGGVVGVLVGVSISERDSKKRDNSETVRSARFDVRDPYSHSERSANAAMAD
jgi:membrane associated rhomboid family serine protease